MTPRLFAAAFALLLAAPAVAQPPAPANTDPAAVRPGAYVVEPSHTRITFAVSHLGFTTWYGDFTRAAGTLTIDPARPAADKVEVTVQTASVATTNAKLDGELRDPTWLDAARFPIITFRATRVTPTGAGQADVTGDFTLHGVTRPLTLHAVFNGAGVNPLSKAYTVGFQGTAVIHRSDFGVTKYVPLVGDEVRITISAAFEQH
jgi:polyisoprenoid-binding protein YceI